MTCSNTNIRRRLKQCAPAALSLFSIACAATDAPFTDAVHVHSRNAVLLFVDGLDTQRLATIDAAGKTPNIHNHFIANGLQFTHATDCFPTVTYSNAVSLMTGLYPGHHGIVANAWFDRSTGRYEDYVSAFTYLNVDADYKAKTIYECLAPDVTSSVQCAAARGATWRWQAPFANGLDWAAGAYQAVDRRVAGRINDVVRRARREREWPIFQTFYFPGVDKCAHTRGVESERYAEAVENADTQIGRVIDTIERVVGPGKTNYWLVADHGQMNCTHDRDLDLAKLLHKRTGVKICRPSHHGVSDRCEILLIPGRRHAMIHVRGKNGWARPADDESIERIVAALETKRSPNSPHVRISDSVSDRAPHLVPGVRCVYARLSGNRVCVLNAEGRRIVSCDAAKVALAQPRRNVMRRLDLNRNCRIAAPAYVATVGSIKKSARAIVDHDSLEDSSLFDRELAALFESPRTGDVVVFAADGWVFESFDCGGHGGASPRERHIPLYVAGPGVPAGAKCDDPVRIIDVMPTIMDMLGLKDRLPNNLDGRSRLADLKPEVQTPNAKVSDLKSQI